MRRRTLTIAILAVALWLPACTRDVPGSVFVVTQGRDNVKLALVEVQAIPRRQAEPVLRARVEAVDRELRVIASNFAEASSYEERQNIRAKHEALRDPAVYLSGLPSPSASAKSDADGRFHLELKRFTSYLVMAKARRGLPTGKEEEYLWAVWVEPGTKEIMLSNDNMIGAGGADSAVRVVLPERL